MEHFKAQRDQIGVVCPKCGSTEHIWLRNKLRYECKHCHYCQSLRSGTVLEFTKLQFRYWYVAMRLLTCTKSHFRLQNCNDNWDISVISPFGKCKKNERHSGET